MPLSNEQLQQQLELYQQIIKTLEWLLGGIVAMVVTMIGILHSGITKRLDKLDDHLDPALKTLERYGVDILNLKDDVNDLKQWQGNHDERIQRIERQHLLKS